MLTVVDVPVAREDVTLVVAVLDTAAVDGLVLVTGVLDAVVTLVDTAVVAGLVTVLALVCGSEEYLL